MEYTLVPYSWKEHIFHMRITWKFSIHYGKWTNSTREERMTKLDKQISSHLWIHFVTWRDTSWWLHCSSKRTLPNLLETESRCSILDKFFQSAGSKIAIMANKPFAIITYATVTGDCIYRVISQNGDRVFSERRATPRPAPKITLKSRLANTAAAAFSRKRR